jgi:hypothetical protein
MVLWDVNLLLYAAVERSAHHGRCRLLLQSLLEGSSGFAVSELILSAVVRIASHPKVFDPPFPPAKAFAFCNSLLSQAATVPIAPGPRHWRIFQDLVEASGVQGAEVTDAYLAALAMEHGCRFWTADTAFGRFPGLRWHNPLVTADAINEGRERWT